MKSPFKFLDAYNRQDKEIFFGRSEEIEQLYKLIFQTNLVLVYGQSGTGKTSLIQCGLANRFRHTDWFELFVRRKDNLNLALQREIRRYAETPIADVATVAEALQSLYLDHLRPVYLIFDQFEELFILGSKEEQQIFIRTIAALLKSEVACKIIFAMREEYLAMLYDFEKAVPSLFNKRFRVEPMSLHNVQQVITGTTAAFGIELEQGEATAQQIIDKLSDHRAGVQLSYLQVYLDKLYRSADAQKSEDEPMVFSERLVEQTGALGDVLADFLEEQTAAVQQELANQYLQTPAETVQLILEEFATLEGTKQPKPLKELAESLPKIPPKIIAVCLAALEQRRILRNFDGIYELAHDTLAGRIAEKRSVERKQLLKIHKLVNDRYSAYEQTRTGLNKDELNYISPYLAKLSLSAPLSDFVQKSRTAARRKARSLIISVLVIFSILVGLTSWALHSADVARRTTKEVIRQKAMADSSLLEANHQKENAQRSATEAIRQRAIADSNAVEARRQKKIAEKNAAEAIRQRALADSSAAEAIRQRIMAILSAEQAADQTAIAKNKAKEAELQRMKADSAATAYAELYEKYVALETEKYKRFRKTLFTKAALASFLMVGLTTGIVIK